MCGEPAGIIEEGQGFRPRDEMPVRMAGKRMVCGRCGGLLTQCERTERYSY
jgi:hypothetical protein